MSQAASLSGIPLGNRKWPVVLASGLLSAWLVVAIEVSATLVLHHRELSSSWEFLAGTRAGAPSWAVLSLVPALLSTAFAHLAPFSAGARRIGASLLLALLLALTAYGVGGGRHLPTVTIRLVFAALVGLSAYFTAYFLLPRFGGLLQKARWWALSLACLLALGCVLANHFLLVRLYPAFHLALSIASYTLLALSATLAVVSDLSLQGKLRAVFQRALPIAALAGLLIAAACLPQGARKLSHLDNYRFWIGQHAPTLAWGQQLAHAIAPPPPLDQSALRRPLGARAPASGLDLSGRNILLITVDALRADYLGSYGQKLPLTPALDALAKDAVVFDAAYAPTPHTSYSLTSLMTGKYMRPLILQGAGLDSQLFPQLLATYGYKTAGFYPPAVFFIDGPRFDRFSTAHLGFEYFKVEFLEGPPRVGQVQNYLQGLSKEDEAFVWVHLFGPHEPYDVDPRFDFGEKDEERYASEVRAADQTMGELIDAFRARDPKSVIIVSADHGEEFGEHGGRYHGTTVFEEQVRVPLLVSVPEALTPHRVAQPVQTIDILPTVLAGLSVPIPARIRGRDLSSLLGQKADETLAPAEDEPDVALAGLAMSETDDFSLLARGSFRLVCDRKAAACRLYELRSDPKQTKDQSSRFPRVFQTLLAESRQLSGSHGELESQGLRSEGKGWPSAVMRGLSGDADAAAELALLLEDADVAIRRKSAELLFQLASEDQVAALRLALSREDDEDTRVWESLALSRLGLAVPYVRELLESSNEEYRRWAALSLAEQGEDAGAQILIEWFFDQESVDFAIRRRITSVLGKMRGDKVYATLLAGLKDVRLRPYIAAALAELGDKDAKPHLSVALNQERFRTTRLPLAQALLQLGAHKELIVPLRRFLGVPEPMREGISLARQAKILDDVGGPSERELARAQQFASTGVQVEVTIPGAPSEEVEKHERTHRKRSTVRFVAEVLPASEATVLYLAPGKLNYNSKKNALSFRNRPDISGDNSLKLEVPAGDEPVVLFIDLPQEFGARPGYRQAIQLYTQGDLQLKAFALVPLRDELPPLPKEEPAPSKD